MKITFIVQTGAKTHLIQHDTTNIPRPRGISNRQINVELEWARYRAKAPWVVDRLTPEDNPLDTPRLVGAVEGAVKWFDGVDEEPRRDAAWDKQFHIVG